MRKESDEKICAVCGKLKLNHTIPQAQNCYQARTMRA